jgi:hypothetical protein
MEKGLEEVYGDSDTLTCTYIPQVRIKSKASLFYLTIIIRHFPSARLSYIFDYSAACPQERQRSFWKLQTVFVT